MIVAGHIDYHGTSTCDSDVPQRVGQRGHRTAGPSRKGEDGPAESIAFKRSLNDQSDDG